MPYVKGVTKRRQILPTPEEARNSDVTAGPGLAYIRWRTRTQTTQRAGFNSSRVFP
jgi:hypothetical protein